MEGRKEVERRDGACLEKARPREGGRGGGVEGKKLNGRGRDVIYKGPGGRGRGCKRTESERKSVREEREGQKEEEGRKLDRVSMPRSPPFSILPFPPSPSSPPTAHRERKETHVASMERTGKPRTNAGRARGGGGRELGGETGTVSGEVG